MKARHEFKNEKEYKEYLRTYVAVSAMQGLLVSLDPNLKYGDTAQIAVIQADALINALNEPNT